MNRTSVYEDDGLHDDLGFGREPRRDRRRGHRRSRGHRFRGCLAVLLSLTVLAVIGGGVMIGLGKGRDYVDKLFAAPDYTGQGTGTVTVEITRGQTADDIAKTLEAKGVVKSAKAFQRAARDDVRSRSIQAGTYQLRKQMSAKAALALLLDPQASQIVNRVSVPSGKTVKQAAAIIQASKAAKLPPGAVAAALAKPQTLGLPSYARNRPEGFLYPETYDLPKGATATSILRQMTRRYAQVAASLKLEQTARAKGIDPYQAVIVASLIQAESNRRSDYPKVARVIYNRLNKNMPLGMDSTIHYITGRTGSVYTTPADRRIDSPYNTYLHTGLPPTPINSPTEETLRAALNPAAGSWLYFVTVDLDTGETAFASTLAEHEANRAQLRIWCGQHQSHPGC
ncbi:MAG TPA: endolytic transglycosylase MltG [Kribbellaceae bacterium]|nr:endolytic transglycosylase MltG [Kribbellaceae bacterium]